MRTTKGIPWRMGLCGVVAGAVLLSMAAGVQAGTAMCTDDQNCKIASDRPASIVIYPKILVDTSNGVDTIIQLTNAGERRTIDVNCFYVNANGHCSNTGDICRDDSGCDTGATCVQGWEKRDFQLRLTKRQPISWRASENTLFLPCSPEFLQQNPDAVCGLDDQHQPIFAAGSIPFAPEDPFIGELKCVQVNESEVPVDFNELKGEATIVRTTSSGVDVAKYNALGIQAIPGRQDNNNTLCIGGNEPTSSCPNAAEYAGCPQTLVLDHFFDYAKDHAAYKTITSDLTLIPCSQDFESSPATNLATKTTIQFLVFNEYEQRFSTSIRIACFDERQLSDIDTRLGDFDDGASIFSVSVQGSLTGQTRIRAVGTSDEARGFLGLLEEFHTCDNGPGGYCSADVGLHYQGRRSLGDIIQIGP